MRGLGFGLGIGRGRAFQPPFIVAFTGLSTDSIGSYGRIGNHAAIGSTTLVDGSPVTPDERIWSAENPSIPDKSGAAPTFGTGANPTGFAVADGFFVYLHTRIGTDWITRAMAVRYAPGSPSNIADGQTYTVGVNPGTEQVIPTGANLTFSQYQAEGLPAGRSINPANGAINGTPTAQGSGTATVSARDQYGRRAEYLDTFTWSVAPGVVLAAPTLTATAVLSGRTYTVTVTSLTGTPTPSVAAFMEVNGDATPLPLVSPGVYAITFGSSAVALNVTGTLTASNNVLPNAVFSFSTTVAADITLGDPVNPVVDTATFILSGGGQRAVIDIQGTYSGGDPIVADLGFWNTATNDEPTGPELAGQTTGADAFVTVPMAVSGGVFSLQVDIDPEDLILIAPFVLADPLAVDRLSFRIREVNNGGASSVITRNVSGLDGIVPVFASATTDTAGSRITVTNNGGALTGTPVLAEASATVNGSPRAISAVAIVGGQLQVTLATVAAFGDTITLTYTNASGAVRDNNGNPLVPFSAQAVTNAVESGAEIISITYDTAGALIEYTGTLSATYDTAGVILEVN